MMTIRQARLAKEITQADMAKSLGVHTQTYRKLEAHPEDFTVAQAKKIAGVLDMPYDDLIFASTSTLSRDTPDPQT